MSDKTGIQWTDATWNPVRGCSRVSEGCRHCYAERVAARFSGPGQPYEGLVKLPSTANGATGPRWNGVVRMVPEHLADPLRWKKPRRVFVNSMSDLFHESLSNEDIAAVFGVMAAAPRHTFQVLTKRAERMRDWFRWVEAQAVLDGNAGAWCISHLDDEHPGLLGDRVFLGVPWPLPNVWLGVSVEDQPAADDRIPHLQATPAAVRFLSCEPLLGMVDLLRWMPPQWADGQCPRCDQWIDAPGWNDACPKCGAHDHHQGSNVLLLDTLPWLSWVIAGCESGPGARPAQVDWYRSLRDQCAAAGVPFFLKQAKEGYDDTLSEGVIDGMLSTRKAGGVIGLPYLDGVQHAAFPDPSE